MWKLIGKGKSGWFAESKNCHSSSYDPRESRLLKYLSESDEDVLIFDASNCDITEYTEFVYNEPMVDFSLEPNETERFGSKKNLETVKFMLPGLQEMFRTLAVLSLDDKFSGLDSVGIAVYESLLRKLNGMKIGHVVDGEIQWEIIGQQELLK